MIEPGFEILLGFLAGLFGYFALTQNFEKIITIAGIITFLIASFIAFLNNGITEVLINYVFFIIGSALGSAGVKIFETCVQPIFDRF